MARLGDILGQFLWHVFLKQQQALAYEQDKRSCQEPGSTCALVQLDFSENYSASYQDETASAYFGQKQITVYTVTIWNRDSIISEDCVGV